MKHDDVGVLLEGARLAQVRELRAVVDAGSGARDSCDSATIGTLSSLARPLSEREIDASSSVRFSKRPRPCHQLDVVDDQQVRPCSALQAPRLGAHLEHADAGRVVDEQLRLDSVSSACVLPVVALADLAARSRWLSMRASDVSMRMKSCSFDISRLKNPTSSRCVATCWQMLSTRLVLPIDGRAATMTRSPGWKPARHLVEVVEAGGHAGDQLLCSKSFSIFGKLSFTSSRIGTNPVRTRSSAIAKIALSASSRIRSASWSAS
jgi:hypothetical protein